MVFKNKELTGAIINHKQATLVFGKSSIEYKMTKETDLISICLGHAKSKTEVSRTEGKALLLDIGYAKLDDLVEHFGKQKVIDAMNKIGDKYQSEIKNELKEGQDEKKIKTFFVTLT